jgi:hypothetical protein
MVIAVFAQTLPAPVHVGLTGWQDRANIGYSRGET